MCGTSDRDTNMSSEPVLVAAIDFGTTFSGYAFSFRHDYQRDPLKISANNWIAGGQALISQKTPSVILLTPQKQFHSFGYEAENKYSELADDGKHKDWLYFRRFKMVLHKNKSLRRSTIIKDEKDHVMPAQTIFTMSIQYLKNHLMKSIHEKVVGMDDSLIRWVVTVPAIWDDGAKQFMREAAQNAGIKGDQLLLALEPEAASLYCNRVPVVMKSSMNLGSSAGYGLEVGTKYMVVDLGGGTADITVHEVQENRSLREIHSATGGAWGGTKVDGAFYQFLVKLFGNDIILSLKDSAMDDFLSLFRDFETKKRTIKQSMEGKITIRIPLRLMEIFKKETGQSFEEALKDTNFSGTVVARGDKIQIQCRIFKEFFNDAIQGIVGHVLEVLNDCSHINVSRVLLVGGFSESEMVLGALKDLLPGKKIIAPQDPGLAVLKGAVLYGHDPCSISSRISHFTYGFEVFNAFVEGVHKNSYRVKRPDGRIMCGKMFEKYVEIGEEVPVGHKIERSFTPSDEDAETGIGFYASTERNPEYITERSCRQLGKIVIRRPNGGWSEGSQLHVSMEFGNTEFIVKIRDDCLEDTYTRSYDFLS